MLGFTRKQLVEALTEAMRAEETPEDIVACLSDILDIEWCFVVDDELGRCVREKGHYNTHKAMNGVRW